jgi:hypothetical protein
MATKISVTVLSILTLLFAFSCVGLAICIRYSYFENISHYQEDLCEINGCEFVEYTCCKICGGPTSHRPCCDTCSYYLVNVTLYLNNTIYDKTIQSGLCTEPNMSCYYDDRNVYDTLTLNPLSPRDSILGISLLSIFITIALIAVIIVAIFTCCEINFEMKKKEEIDNL